MSETSENIIGVVEILCIKLNTRVDLFHSFHIFMLGAAVTELLLPMARKAYGKKYLHPKM